MSAAPAGHCPLHEGVEMVPATSPRIAFYEEIDRVRRDAARDVAKRGIPTPECSLQEYEGWLSDCARLGKLERALWRLRVCPSCSPTLRVGHLFVEAGTGRQEWR